MNSLDNGNHKKGRGTSYELELKGQCGGQGNTEMSIIYFEVVGKHNVPEPEDNY